MTGKQVKAVAKDELRGKGSYQAGLMMNMFSL